MEKKNIKILLISQEKVLDVVNGATRILYYFANGLKERGYDVVVTYPNNKNPQCDKYLDKDIKFYNLNYIDMSNFKSTHKKLSILDRIIMWRCKKELKLLRMPELSDKIEAIIQKEKPDIIIPFFAHVTSQLVFGRKYNIPIIQMYHSHPKVYHTKAPIFKKSSKPMAILFNHTVKKVNWLQLFFDSYAEFIKPFYKGETCIIHNPIKTPNAQANLSTTKKKLIYLSRIDKNKGQKILIEAFGIIAKSYPDWELLIYGDFEPESYRAVISETISKYQLEQQVKIMGVTKDTSNALAQADIGAYTSSFEGFPLGLSEALSVGLPCIGLRSATGINELIIDRHNGLLCESNQVDIARKLAELMNNRPLREKYGHNAKESMKQYSEFLFWRKWEDLITKALIKSEKLQKQKNFS